MIGAAEIQMDCPPISENIAPTPLSENIFKIVKSSLYNWGLVNCGYVLMTYISTESRINGMRLFWSVPKTKRLNISGTRFEIRVIVILDRFLENTDWSLNKPTVAGVKII